MAESFLDRSGIFRYTQEKTFKVTLSIEFEMLQNLMVKVQVWKMKYLKQIKQIFFRQLK